ncbi:MAG: carboxypeptidase regulatory-like domain-containing protein [Crocinitomicaceae bacterium]|nr:carboxypeptidase regulatory-like domain-containing protein [Flavobacteriales bacterium]NQZ37306.1 carboxypeptidase regulatory-like domain-containing protein [Crocinitomicaceae bacterium]
MLRKLNLVLVSVLLTMSYGFSQTGLGTLKGVVSDADSGEPIPFAKVVIKQGDLIKAGAETDFDGSFQINSINAGSYDVVISNEVEGYKPQRMTGVRISSEQITFLDDIALGKGKDVQDMEEVEVIAYKIPLINKDGGASGTTITREDIARLPVRSAAGVAGTVGGVNAQEGGGISVRGSRSDATYYYIDGIKVRGSANLPKSAIEEVKVITGGVPANYGDVTGGIISVTTRGPSAQYFGSIEGVTSGFYFKGKDPDGYDGKVFGLDQYGYNLVEGMFSGPLWMQKDSTGKKTKPRLGFLISANITDRLDARPLAGGAWRIKKDVRDELLINPLRPTSTGTGTFYNADFLRTDDFEKVPWRMNSRNTNLSAQGKVDVNTGPSVNLSFGGSLNYSFGSQYSYAGSLLNFQNFGAFKSLDWRVFGRLTQRFTNNTEGSSSKIRSANYSLMVDYSKSKNDAFDPKHQYKIFNYGHVGTYTTTRRPSYDAPSAANNYVYTHNGFQEVVVDFTPSETNPALAAITEQYYNIYEGNPEGNYETLLQIQQGRALRNGDTPQSVYSIWSNIGAPYNYFGKTENDQFRVTGSGSVNIGDHSLSLGFEYEQRWDRGWTAGTNTNGGGNGPIGIWTIARQLMNFHITELDTSAAFVTDSGSYKRVTYNRLNTGEAYLSGTGVYGGAENSDNQSFFDYNLREYLHTNGWISQGGDGNDFIDIDQYDPNIYSFDMFSPDELLNSGNSFVSYWGYDHTGKKVRGTTDINKYFNEFDENGNYKRFVGAFQPIYMAGYIMDKFAFRDIVFNVGLRVDVFDANQPVLKDPYLFYSARTVAEAKTELANNSSLTWIDIPDAMGDDFTVYVDDVNNPNAINGYRSGTVWYDADGVETEDPSTLRGSAGIQPWLLDPSQETPGADAFEDYKAQINVMPRVSFSFPISDEAAFFAHYDILTKRPTSGFRFDPFQYQFVNDRSAIINNANLKPETTVDYELGFQQVLSKTSSLKISAFYREQRNNVQLMNIFEAYPSTYRTYGNRDFGTVKGMTVEYDMRRTGNMRLRANYTLQFADGTGSDATSAAGLVNAGLPNLRAIFPYSFDQRHAFAVTMDYRYGSGKDYNGPKVKDAEIFANTGLNIVSNIYSGSPYSSQTVITNAGQFSPLSSGLDGTTNGSRLPWSYRLDLQLDRTFDLQLGKEGNKKATFLNVYVRVTNLFNQFNVLGVYRATGNPDDDGYLAAAASQTSIQNQLDEQSFRDYYNMKIQNSFNISSPRTIRLGVKFDF